LGWLLNKD